MVVPFTETNRSPDKRRRNVQLVNHRKRKEKKKTLWHKEKLSSIYLEIRSTRIKVNRKLKKKHTQNASQVKWYDHLIAFSTFTYIRTVSRLFYIHSWV